MRQKGIVYAKQYSSTCISLCVCLFVCLSICVFVPLCLSICHSLSRAVCLTHSLSLALLSCSSLTHLPLLSRAHLSLLPSVCVCLSIYLSVCLPSVHAHALNSPASPSLITYEACHKQRLVANQKTIKRAQGKYLPRSICFHLSGG